MFDVFYLGRAPGLFAHERPAESIDHARSLSRTRYCWIVEYLADYTGFDFIWEPVPWQSNYIHAWPSQWHQFSGTFLVPCFSNTHEYHFHDQVVPNRSCPDDFDVLTNAVDFDYSWAPHPLDPPYRYVFGNQWWPAEVMPTVVYSMPGATDIKYMSQPQAQLLPQHNNCWHTLVDCEWDYSWVPDPGDPPYIYVFGNQWWGPEKMPTVEYHVTGATERKYITYPRATLLTNHENWVTPDSIDHDAWDYSWCPDPGDPPYIYHFGTQWQKTNGPSFVVPGATTAKYIPYPRAVKISTDNNWEIPEGAEIASFDWTWHPDSTDSAYIYQFGTQHQRTGGPRYVVPGATEVKYVDQIRITTRSQANQVYMIDHSNGAIELAKSTLSQDVEISKTTRFVDNYLDTLRRIANSVPDGVDTVWICSSLCDYTDFDFSWHPELWQSTLLHVFASNKQKFGDTFFMHVPTFRDRAQRCQLLEWYDLNFVPNVSVPRLPLPVVQHTLDTHVNTLLETNLTAPLTLFTIGIVPTTLPAVNVWRRDVRAITPLSPGGSCVIVPKDAKISVKQQFYDYKLIDKAHYQTGLDQPQDIVFISNGESNAETNWQHLLQVTQGIPNRVVRVDGVNGRKQAYQAALTASNTPWAFCVFAKLEVDPAFDWSWQPDRMQQAKHYVFHALNPITGLEYGHMAMIAYNKELVMSHTGEGLDFTLDQLHEVVPVRSGVARYADDPWTAWRSAFRECIKLRHSLPDVENEYRLDRWLKSSGNDAIAKWSQIGAQDAVEYYSKVQGEFALLKLTYEWQWLSEYLFTQHKLTPDQLCEQSLRL